MMKDVKLLDFSITILCIHGLVIFTMHDVHVIQWRIQVFSDEGGATTPRVGGATILFGHMLPDKNWIGGFGPWRTLPPSLDPPVPLLLFH